YVAVYVASSLTGVSFYARYLLPLVPLVSILVLGARAAEARPTRALAASGIATLAVLGILGAVAAGAHASAARAEWALAGRAAEVVGSTDLVDGGLEWNNLRLGEVRHSQDHPPPGTCVKVGFASALPTGTDVVSREQVWTAGNDLWVVARRTKPCPDE